LTPIPTISPTITPLPTGKPGLGKYLSCKVSYRELRIWRMIFRMPKIDCHLQEKNL
jgi:hypothetical protein